MVCMISSLCFQLSNWKTCWLAYGLYPMALSVLTCRLRMVYAKVRLMSRWRGYNGVGIFFMDGFLL